MTKRIDFLSGGILGAASRTQQADLADLTRALVSQRRNPRELSRDDDEELIEILSPRQFEERIGRERRDLVGDMDLDDDDDDDDDDAGYIGVDDIIGAMNRAVMGARLSKKDRKAIRKAKRGMKKAARRGGDEGLALALRQAERPIVLTDGDNIMRKLNMPLSTITVAATSSNSFAVVVQETMRLERLFLYPVGGSYDNLWVGDIFCGRNTNSIVPGNEEPMINYSPTAVDSGIEGFTVNYGLTLRINIRNGTGAPVVVGGKIKGRTLT